MRSNKRSTRLIAVLVILASTLFASPGRAAAQQETILHSFPGSSEDGYDPTTSLIFDPAGNLYGTTYFGGTPGGCPASDGCGIVFELTPVAGGGWTEKVLHAFKDNGKDGYYPNGALTRDGAGNLYGTTFQGGSHNDGTVFELVPGAGGIWKEMILHNFNVSGNDGYEPVGALVLDAAGNLYGTTDRGGSHQQGTVFELTHLAGGGWSEKILHNFNANATDGYYPQGVIFDSAGNLYGTTFAGGAYGVGTAFMLKHATGGGWTEKNLHNFANTPDGDYPHAGLVFDSAGNLYGTTGGGGAYSEGTVFELTLTTGGNWMETVLYSFSSNINGTNDGALPSDTLVLDAAGNLYGTTDVGGASNNGTVFRLSPASGGTWTEDILYSFGGIPDGDYPAVGLIFDPVGNLYGTTSAGGAHSNGGLVGGTVFELTP